MRVIPLFVLVLVVSFSSSAQGDQTALVLARIEYVYKVKLAHGNAAWKDFGEPRYNIPILYFSGNTTFVSNPPDRFIRKYQPTPVAEKKGVKLFHLDYRLDSTAMHMRVNMSNGPDTTVYDYNSPYIKCSSPEEFAQVTGYPIPTQEWAALVVHEFFHGFQFSYQQYVQYALQNYGFETGVGTSLQQMYSSHDWFKNLVDEENGALLRAIAAINTSETDSLIQQFLRLRDERRSYTKSDAGGPTLAHLEKTFETMEGTARFAEAFVIEHPVADKRLKKIDPRYAASVSGTLSEITFRTGKTQMYFYATGYNITRLLQKLKVDFMSRLFKEPALTLEELLREGRR